MKKILQSITLVFMLSFLLTSVGMAQEIQLTHSGNGHPPAEYTDKDGGHWIKYWDSGVNDNALGLGGDGSQWFAAIRWMPEDLVDYENYAVTKVRIFINDEPTDGAVTIWQGDIDNPMVYVSQAMMVVEEDWVETELFDPHFIQTDQELWIGWEIGDPGDGVFPAAFETSTEHDGKANLLQFGDNPWDFASSFGFETVWNIEAYVVYYGDDDDDDDDNDDPDTFYDVTFNVDMTGVEGFDPDEHHVFMTGTLTDWAEPGSEESLQMTLVDNGGAKDAPPFVLYEDWSGYDDFTTDLSPWITLQLTEGNTWGASDFAFPGEGEEFAWMVFNPSETDPPVDEEHTPIDGDKFAVAVQYTDLDDNKWLISPEVSINETSELSFWAKSITAAYGLERIRVLVSTSGEDPGNFIPISTEPYIEVPTDWTQYTFDLSDYAGEVIRFAINYVSHDAFFLFVDAILLHAEEDDDDDPDPDPDVLIYTVTTEVAAGNAEYKYFSDAFGEGWDGGEWAGDPNRVINVSGDMIVDDIWGEIETAIVEVDLEDQFMKLYPNPASSILNIASDHEILNVAVYDITGRMLIQDNNDVVNVSNLRNGLYIIQVTTTAGTESHRFHVAR